MPDLPPTLADHEHVGDDELGDANETASASQDRAAQMVRAYRAVERRVADVHRVADIERERVTAALAEIDTWVETTVLPLGQRLIELEAWLAYWHANESARRGRNAPRSYTFPAGKVAAKKAPLKATVNDLFAFMAWAQDNAPHLIRKPPPAPEPPPAPDLNEIKTRCDVVELNADTIEAMGADVTPGTYFVLTVEGEKPEDTRRLLVPGVLPEGLGDDYKVETNTPEPESE